MSLTPEDSPKPDEFDWDSYLIETESEAAPACNFKQSLIPPANEFHVGEKLETIDPRNRDSWCVGTIIDKDGPRLRLRLDGTDNRNDFWRLVDSGDIRCCGTTEKLGEQIVPPLGFQQTSTRWAKYFEKHVKNGPFAHESCFKLEPAKPEKNLFKIGQKLEAVDPKHPYLICPATVTSITPGDHKLVISLDGWSAANNFKIDYSSRDIFPVGWCKSVGITLTKVGHTLPPRSLHKHNEHVQQKVDKSNTSSSRRVSVDYDENTQSYPIVTVYWNYIGDNGGLLLNPHKFSSFMPAIFGPNQCHLVLKKIFDACIKCSFQPKSFTHRLMDLFPSTSDKKLNSSPEVILENNTRLQLPSMETKDDFWDILHDFQNAILAEEDLFVSIPPDFAIGQNNKRKIDESQEDSIFSTDRQRRPRHVDVEDEPAYDLIQKTPNDVAEFIRNIDPKFDTLASRFLQEEIDGKALVLLTTDTLIKHMGLKLGPSLQIIHHIEKLKSKFNSR
ncbi:unnamed protein product [Adineta ricciae]|uniref:SAM domain-containing protein n=1 Tax=Adineta ricciae TaxID=249248 RepID=A0A814FV32_ADIRI|nr:unnamed protein product [Adineta ricciae]CAF0987668.1 unnamed protein product [Adineta ricciae]